MKKIVLIVLTFLIIIIPVKADDWEDNITGNTSSIGGNGSCYTNWGKRYNYCNNGWFTALQIKLVYYHDNKLDVLKQVRVARYNGEVGLKSYHWVVDVVPGLVYWDKIPSGMRNKDGNFSIKVKNLILNNIKSLFNDVFKINYDGFIKDLKNGKYPKHEPMGSTKGGVRVIVEPIFGFANINGSNHMGTSKAIAELGQRNLLWSDNVRDYSNQLKLERSDIGFTAYSGLGNINQHADPKSGYGIGIFSPFDYIKPIPPDTRCDPGTTGTSIKNCCNKVGITHKNKTKNTTKYLKKVISDYNIEKYCREKPKCYDYKLTDASVNDCNDLINEGVREFTSNDNSWECIFDSPNSKYSEVKNHFEDVSSSENDYCSIYCTQTVRYEFPHDNISTYAGRFLVVGYSNLYPAIGPIKYINEKVCRTTDKSGSGRGIIDYEEFEADIKANDEALLKAWQDQKYQDIACSNAKVIKTETESKCPFGYSKYHEGKVICMTTPITKTTTYYKGTHVANGKTYTCSYELESYPGKPAIPYKVEKGRYYDLLEERQDMIDQMQVCNGYHPSIVFSPEVELEYKDSVYKSSHKLVDKSPSRYSTLNYYRGGSASHSDASNEKYKRSYTTTDSITVNKCNYDGCDGTKTKLEYQANTWVESIDSKEYYFRLDDNTYRYVNKYSGQSFSKSYQAGSNYLKMDVANLPVHYSTKPGKYEYTLKTNTFGYFNELNGYAFKGNSFGGHRYSYEQNYTCTYDVSCSRMVIKDQDECEYYKKTCPTEYAKFGCGSGFIFRPISLESKDEAFPGENGKGRTPGGKWNNDRTIERVITNNRGVKGKEVYKESPMYEITLDKKTLNKIRKYNKEMNSELVTIYNGPNETTGIEGYTSMNGLFCGDGADECISKKIREWGIKGCAVKYRDGSYSKCDGIEPW